jgi:two-component system, cell cycle sensor histidine kinase and response regulator CckA
LRKDLIQEKGALMTEVSGATILLVEDDEVIRELYKKILEFKGYRVIEAVDGKDGVEKFSEHRDEIHILISDVMMPCKNGRETYEEIIKIKNDVKVIFTSGYNTELTNIIQIDGLNYLQKPFSPQLLLQMIEEVLANDQNCGAVS